MCLKPAFQPHITWCCGVDMFMYNTSVPHANPKESSNKYKMQQPIIIGATNVTHRCVEQWLLSWPGFSIGRSRHGSRAFPKTFNPPSTWLGPQPKQPSTSPRCPVKKKPPVFLPEKKNEPRLPHPGPLQFP